MGEITFATFGRKLDAAANAVERSSIQTVRAGSDQLAPHVAVAYRIASGGDGALSGTSRRRSNSGAGSVRGGTGRAAAVSAKVKDVRRYSDGGTVGLVVPTGPYGLIERDIAPHMIGVKTFSRNQRLNSARRAVKQARRAAAAGDQAGFQAAKAKLDQKYQAKLLGRVGAFGPVSGAVRHPGTRGRSVLSRAVATSGPKIARGMTSETVERLKAGYKAGG